MSGTLYAVHVICSSTDFERSMSCDLRGVSYGCCVLEIYVVYDMNMSTIMIKNRNPMIQSIWLLPFFSGFMYNDCCF